MGQSLLLASVQVARLDLLCNSSPASTRVRHRRMTHTNTPVATSTGQTLKHTSAISCIPGRVRQFITDPLAPWGDLEGHVILSNRKMDRPGQAFTLAPAKI